MSNLELSGQVALVTGGATGIGRAIVGLLAERGASVAFTDWTPEAGEKVVGEIPGVRFIKADATREADAAGAVEQTLAAFGRLDIAVNNVGNYGPGDSGDTLLEDYDLEVWDSTIRQSLTTCMLGTKYALRPMVAAGRGSIVNISSLAGIRFSRHSSYAYNAAKAAVVHLSKTLAVTYAPKGVRVNVVAPGLTLTPRIETMDPALRDSLVAEFNPSGRIVSPAEIAEAVVWAASNRSSSVTGVVIPVDGGWAAR